MLHILLIIAAGILIGYLLRNRRFVKHTGTLLSAVIVLLLFFLGVSVGANEQVVNNFAVIGQDAFILTSGGTLGCVLCAWWVYARFWGNDGKRKIGKRQETKDRRQETGDRRQETGDGRQNP